MGKQEKSRSAGKNGTAPKVEPRWQCSTSALALSNGASVRIDPARVPEIEKARLVTRLLDGLNAAIANPETWAVIDKKAQEIKARMKGGGGTYDG